MQRCHRASSGLAAKSFKTTKPNQYPDQYTGRAGLATSVVAASRNGGKGTCENLWLARSGNGWERYLFRGLFLQRTAEFIPLFAGPHYPSLDIFIGKI
jgi:hypothetical protein